MKKKIDSQHRPDSGFISSFGRLCCAAAVLAAVPLVMLWQSANRDKGTSKGFSIYNVHHVNSGIAEYAINGSEEGLLFYINVLQRDGNTEAIETWLSFGAKNIGTPAVMKAYNEFMATARQKKTAGGEK